jgi:hypothetical protein
MVTPDTVSIWLQEQVWPLGVVIFLILAGLVVLKLSANRRRAVLSRERCGVTERIFVEHLAGYDFDAVITGTTYRYLREVQGVQFPVLPSDRLDEDLGMDQDDVEQVIGDLLGSLQREYRPGLRYEPILTVEGLVRHLQASPRKVQRAGA